ncbi:MAG: TRAP transporter small permease subunit [Acetobacteraceae bacterium]|nr:TRAP transporter small permease subunit [Acetobacteraceae bacterium]MDW8397416.1 TRAP transporter small permease subunit [Acetobacteraceae bacterium]
MWLSLLLVLVQFAVVVLRYAFGTSFIMMQEGVIYLHAILFMLAIGYTFLVDQHVRVDVLYAGWSARRRALVDLIAVLVGVLPFCALVVWASWSYVLVSWRFGEGPMAVGGLPFTPFLKSMIPAMAVLLALQSLSIAVRCVAVLRGLAETHLPHRAHQGSA